MILRRPLLAGLGLLAACRSPEPVLYTILPAPGAPRRAGPRAVAVREVSLAGYLDRQQIVKSAAEVRLDVSGNDWWGEPLGPMVTRVLVENLAQRLPGASVFATAGAISTPAEATVEVNLQRLGLAAPGQLGLGAQAAVRFREGGRRDATRTLALTVPVAGADTPAFVAAAGEAIGQLADAVAAMLAG